MSRPRPPATSGAPHAPTPSAPERSWAWALFAALTALAVVAIVADVIDSGGAGTVATDGEPADDAAADSDAVAGTDGSTNDGSDESADAGGSDTGLRSFTLAVTGDILIHESVAENARTADGFDFTPQFAEVQPIISSADLALCHLEVTLSETNTDLEYYPAFRVPNQLAANLASVGYDSCSTASNHALDAGEPGVISTLDYLDRAGLAHVGTARNAEEALEVNLLDVGGARVAHLSYSYGFNGTEVPTGQPWLANTIDESRILNDATVARAAGADFVIVSMHWGTEYRNELTDQQAALGPALLGSPDIDLIVGHHAHVLQRIDQYDGEYVINGLGNFISNQSPETCSECPPGVQDGAIIELRVSEQANGLFAVSSIGAVSTYVDRIAGHRIMLAAEDGTEAAVSSYRRTRDVFGTIPAPTAS